MTNQLLRTIFILLLLAVPIKASSANVSFEGYGYNPLSKRLSEIDHDVDIYANGTKIITKSRCTQKEPCKAEVLKKSILTLCSKAFEGVCQTNIRFDPLDSPSQRFAFVLSTSTYFASYTIYRPEEMPVIDEFLTKQAEAEKQRDEIKNRAPN